MNYTFWIIFFLILFVISVCLLNRDKIVLFLKSLKFKIKPKKTKRQKNKDENDKKLKVAETQIRPTLLPPTENKPLLNEPKNNQSNNEMIEENNVSVENNSKNINFGDKTLVLNKIGNLNQLQNEENKNVVNSSFNSGYNSFNESNNLKSNGFVPNDMRANGFVPNDMRANSFDSNYNFKPNTFSQDRFNPSNNRYKTRQEIDREFEEVRKFLDIPPAKTPFKPSFNDISPIKRYNETNENKSSFENFSNSNVKRGFEPASGFKNANAKFKNQEEIEKFANKEIPKNIIKVDGDEIDLNKLPSNLKKLLISSVLARKDYD